ncbi:BamA/TamA family outer membrane protein [Pseudotamlana carrageenivorans]|uniref:Bacterial surface antigen (D15) domain-containing protein n=1 Tax=Pseudotamlana carrageenivorans TaxID=2069432 RepID=A0A2I7SHV2_9FLAO|nr:BamA/TamA family outer membrane protein [Tamlana carrageenivorans]AUS05444.1 hypothetical protein C1A40_08165 [Tamlana carrageenivorans]
MKRHIFLSLLICSISIIAQHDSTIHRKKTDSTKHESKFDQFNKKAEAFFKKFPVPIYSHLPEAGNIYGLTKFNILQLSQKDTISKPSKLSELFTLSSRGQINASISTELIFKENNRVVEAYINYKKQPDYIFGIGNNVKREDVEEIQLESIKFFSTYMFRFNKYFYVGVPINFSSYFNIETEPDSFLIRDKVTGLDGGIALGTGLAFSYDSRDNRYNPQQGTYVMTYILTNPKFLGSTYQFSKYEIDARKYFNPWLNHIIAIQATTSNTPGNTPFYGSRAKVGGF